MDIATIVGFIAIGTVTMVGVGPYLDTMIDVPSAIIVGGGTLAALLASFRLEDAASTIRCIRYAFFPPKPSAEPSQLREDFEIGLSVLTRARTYAQAMGWIGVFIGLLIMMTHLDDPAEFLRRPMAICLLTAMYGTGLGYLLCLPLQTKIERHLMRLDK